MAFFVRKFPLFAEDALERLAPCPLTLRESREGFEIDVELPREIVRRSHVKIDALRRKHQLQLVLYGSQVARLQVPDAADLATATARLTKPDRLALTFRRRRVESRRQHRAVCSSSTKRKPASLLLLSLAVSAVASLGLLRTLALAVVAVVLSVVALVVVVLGLAYAAVSLLDRHLRAHDYALLAPLSSDASLFLPPSNLLLWGNV